MKLTYRKTLSGAPFGLENIIVEEDVCLHDIPKMLRAIREQVKQGLKPEKQTPVEGPLDTVERFRKQACSAAQWTPKLNPNSH